MPRAASREPRREVVPGNAQKANQHGLRTTALMDIFMPEVYISDTMSYDNIHLEITEEAYISDDSLTQMLNIFHESDFKIVLDDFGTGYSSLSRVIQNHFSNIKLDMSFVRGSMRGQNDILAEMIQAFHKLGNDVTAEGVETQAMAEKLASYGCDYLQGYLYSKPLPTSDFLQKYGAAEARG